MQQQQVAIGGAGNALNVQPAPAVPPANVPVPGQLNNLRLTANNAHQALLLHAGNIQPIKKGMNKILKLLDKIHHALPQADIDKVYADQKKILENLMIEAHFNAAQMQAFYAAFDAHKAAHTAMANYARNIRQPNPIAVREIQSRNPKMAQRFGGNITYIINQLIADKKEIMTKEGAVETKDGFLTSTSAKALAAVIAAMGGPVVLGKKGDSAKVLAEVYRILKDEYHFQHPISISPDVRLGVKGFILGPHPIRALTSGPEVQRISLIELGKPNVFNQYYDKNQTEKLAQTFLRLDQLAYTFVGTNFSRWDVIRNEAKTAQEKFDLAVEIAARKELSLPARRANDPDTAWSRAEFIKVFRGVFKSNKLPRVSTFVPREQRGQFDALMPGFDAAVDARKLVLENRRPAVPGGAAPAAPGAVPPPIPGVPGMVPPVVPGGPGGIPPYAPPVVGGAAPHIQPVVPGAQGANHPMQAGNQQPEFIVQSVQVEPNFEVAQAVYPIDDSSFTPNIVGRVQDVDSHTESDSESPDSPKKASGAYVSKVFTDKAQSQSPQSEEGFTSSSFDSSAEEDNQDEDSSNSFGKK